MDHAIDQRIFRLINRISDDLGHNWTIEEMAAEFGITTQHFQKLFKQEVGMPPMTWLHDRRLEKVEQLLLTTYQPIKVIGFNVSLKNISHLTRDFKKKFGFTPTGYRKHHAAIEQSQATKWTEMIVLGKK